MPDPIYRDRVTYRLGEPIGEIPVPPGYWQTNAVAAITPEYWQTNAIGSPVPEYWQANSP